MTNLAALLIRHKIQRRMLETTQAIDICLLKEPNMAVSPDVAALVTEFDDATNAIASRIQNLINASHSLSEEDKAALQSEVTKLQALGADQSNPVPGV